MSLKPTEKRELKEAVDNILDQLDDLVCESLQDIGVYEDEALSESYEFIYEEITKRMRGEK